MPNENPSPQSAPAPAGTKSYWLTKYALSDGITAVDVDHEPSEYGYVTPKGYWVSFKVGKDIHDTEAAAKKAAAAMRVKKIASLKKQIAALEKLEF